jgi:small subunit ribosomal protein S15
MALEDAPKKAIIEENSTFEGDTSSPEVLLTHRIADITEHLRTHQLDHHGRRG